MQEMMSSSSNWSDVNDSTIWQDRIFNTLAIPYGIVSIASLIQLVRIQLRHQGNVWSMQTVFSLFNFVVHGVRAVVFVFRRNVLNRNSQVLQHILLDMPSLGYFTTYAYLFFFWAIIYYQARGQSTDRLNSYFITMNAIVYLVQVSLWVVLWWNPVRFMVILSTMFTAGVSLFVAFGFLFHGGRLFLMLRRFPVETKGRSKKLKEVGSVAIICVSCFLIRCIMMCFAAFYEGANLYVMDNPIFNFIYYLLVEILPFPLVMFILRALPPKRDITQ